MTGVIIDVIGQKNMFQTFCRNIKPFLYKSVFPCVGASRTYAEIWPFQVSSVFIDADHEYECVLEDMKLWWPHVLSGGVLCGHDWISFKGVQKAVNEFCSDKLQVHSHREMWWIEKP